MYKLDKARYGLKQAPRAWYDRLSTYLQGIGYSRGNVDPTLFTKCDNKDILLVQIYVDDIIFGSTKPSLCKKFSDLMTKEFEMSLMGELKFFSWTADNSSVRKDIHKSVQVYQGVTEEISNGECQANQCPNGYINKSPYWSRR